MRAEVLLLARSQNSNSKVNPVSIRISAIASRRVETPVTVENVVLVVVVVVDSTGVLL